MRFVTVSVLAEVFKPSPEKLHLRIVLIFSSYITENTVSFH